MCVCIGALSQPHSSSCAELSCTVGYECGDLARQPLAGCKLYDRPAMWFCKASAEMNTWAGRQRVVERSPREVKHSRPRHSRGVNLTNTAATRRFDPIPAQTHQVCESSAATFGRRSSPPASVVKQCFCKSFLCRPLRQRPSTGPGWPLTGVATCAASESPQPSKTYAQTLSPPHLLCKRVLSIHAHTYTVTPGGRDESVSSSLVFLRSRVPLRWLRSSCAHVAPGARKFAPRAPLAACPAFALPQVRREGPRMAQRERGGGARL